MKSKEKNRVEEALRYHWLGMGRMIRLYRLLKDVFIRDGEAKTCLLSEEEVMSLLKRVDKSDPSVRMVDVWDGYFEQLIPFLPTFPFDEPLIYVAKYWHLTEIFLKLLDKQNIGTDVSFQYRLCEVRLSSVTGEYYPKFGNLLFGYVKRYDLLPEVKVALFDKPMYARIVLLYEAARSI